MPSTTAPIGTQPAPSPEEGTMLNIATATEAEADVRAFAEAYPTANVLEALAHCEAGRLGWAPVRDLFKGSLGEALVEVNAR